VTNGVIPSTFSATSPTVWVSVGTGSAMLARLAATVAGGPPPPPTRDPFRQGDGSHGKPGHLMPAILKKCRDHVTDGAVLAAAQRMGSDGLAGLGVLRVVVRATVRAGAAQRRSLPVAAVVAVPAARPVVREKHRTRK